MLNLKFVRSNLQRVQETIQNRGYDLDISEFERLDEERRARLTSLEELRHRRNTVSEQIALMKKNGEITAYEVRASGIPWNFNPVLGLGRQPLWPRLWETFGEDPYLASQMGAAYVKGLEGENNNIGAPDKVASCIKHYLGYSFPLSGKDRTPAWIPERMLREYFVPPFKAAIDAGAHTLMVNSSEINGIPVHSSYYYLTGLLRHELGFKGFIVSDQKDRFSKQDTVALEYGN